MVHRALPILLLLIPTWMYAQHAITIAPLKECLPAGFVLAEVFVATPEEIGMVMKGAFNSRRQTTIEPDIRTGILHAVRQECPEQEDAIRIAIKVNSLSIHEFLGTPEYALAALNIDVLREEDGQWVHFFNSGATVNSKGLDVTKHHERNITQVLEEVLRDLHTSGTSIRAHFPALAGEALSRPTGESDLWMPIHHGPLPRGLFETFQDFRLGRTMVLDPTDRLGDLDIHKQAKRQRKEIWGYSDGTFIYTWHEKQPFRLERNEDQFVGVLHFTEHDAGAVFVGGVLFGLVGSALADGLSKKHHSVPVILDLMTGELVENNDAELLPGSTKDVCHIIYLSRFGKRDDPVRVLEGDQVLATLDRDTYCEIFFHSAQQSMRLELEVTPGERLEIMLPLEKSGTTVHLVQVDKTGRPVLKPVNQQMNEKLLNSLKENGRRPLAYEPAPR